METRLCFAFDISKKLLHKFDFLSSNFWNGLYQSQFEFNFSRLNLSSTFLSLIFFDLQKMVNTRNNFRNGDNLQRSV